MVKAPRGMRILDARSDVVFRKIFGQHPGLIKSFLNNLLPLPAEHLIETITYLTPEQSPRIPGMKNTIVDVKCTDRQGRIFIVEMQMAWSASFMKRFLFGASKAFVQQLEIGKGYSSLCPVYGLAILNENFEQAEHWYHHYRLTNVQNMDKTLEGLELIFIELQKFKPQTFEQHKIGSLWLRFLREANETLTAIPKEFQNEPDLAMAVELAHESSYTQAELEAYDQYLDAIRVEKTIQADARAQGKAEGKAEGEQIGRAEGEQIGLARGEQLGLEKVAKEMLLDGMAIEKVANLSKLSIEWVKKLADKILHS